jgi:hypothetical protein
VEADDGDTMEVEVIRSGERHVVAVTLRPNPPVG